MKAGIIGATGYAGVELARLLSGHPAVERLCLSSASFEGERFEDVYPHFIKKIAAPLARPLEVIAESDVVFAALPAGVGEDYAEAAVKKGIPFIDLSADFRFDEDEATYTAWYGKPYKKPDLHRASVYGLVELNREKIKAAAGRGQTLVIGNPGCYPTGASLAVYPALAKGLAAPGAAIIVDAASGVTGAGREPARAYHFPECADSMTPYKVGAHRHTPEIARNFAQMEGCNLSGRSLSDNGLSDGSHTVRNVIFTPHLAPMNRGILSTVYLPLSERWQGNLAGIQKLYADFYADEYFVRVLPAGTCAATGRVRLSNFCDISIHLDHSGSVLILVSAIDNMVKGAAGQAVQNMNLLFGLAESAGLESPPALF
jgi:N-acetyl-gamma-glutamyl-phosphate reductase